MGLSVREQYFVPVWSEQVFPSTNFITDGKTVWEGALAGKENLGAYINSVEASSAWVWGCGTKRN